MAEIMTAANLAIAKGYTIKIGCRKIDGMIVHNGKLASIVELPNEPDKYTFKSYCSLPRIVTVKPIDVEIDVIYEPPPVAKPTATPNPDLSSSSP